MSQTEKSGYFQALKRAGVNFPKHYREYSTEELREAFNKLQSESEDAPDPIEPLEKQMTDPEPPPEFFGYKAPEQAQPEPGPAGQYSETIQPPPSAPRSSPGQPTPQVEPGVRARRSAPPVLPRDPNEMAGQRLNSKDIEEPIRTDEDGRIWFQEEVLKPAYPKPRGRRVLKYLERGVKEVTTKSGDYTETFEVAGDETPREQEVKITLPSYQVGIYKDPRFPFKVITYNGNNGFSLKEVREYYGGSELVPAEIKRIYIENVLCYDIRTTVRAIQDEYRQLVLAGKVKP